MFSKFILEKWKNQCEFKSWIRRCCHDFQFSSCGELTDDELVQLVASSGEQCQCEAVCQALSSFLSDPVQFVVTLSLSRVQRHHMYNKTSVLSEVSCQRTQNGITITKLDTHKHAKECQFYHRLVGEQG